MAGKEISLQYARNIVALKVIPEMEEGSQYYEYMIKQTLQELLSYIEEVEGTFKNKLNGGGFIEERRMSTGERIEHLKPEKFEEYRKYEQVFPQIARYSLLTSIYSYTEEWSLDACRKAEAALGLSPTKLDYIQSAKEDGLESSVKIDFSGLQQEWQIINDFREVRNCIIHSRGNINNQYYKKGNKLQSLQAAVGRLTSEGVSLQQDDIYLEEKVCAEFIKAVSRFFEEIYLQIERKVKAKNAPKK
ncbi:MULTISPECIES: hypothetical protein [Bacillus]|uniref:hypothetical protein n=1 Tax=Bacillus TaxID=1386 RepID=UPI0007782BA4|nr:MULTISPECIES: hypothetical protein [Bacillus]KXY13851.1 hypothetical protein AT271_27765 [Bacillus cereus]MCC2438138.1 hypothetical protein [Bacillus paranthracis]MDG1603780.1 hypothetical protein [Bacillus paranthracis]NUJ05033.1 hypothetical protein [Bacillus paranthracis]WAI27781.1 MAG: hypothetical protein NRZ50_05255 [Bacillus paranthracis]